MWLTCFPRLPADEPLQLFVHPVCNAVLPILKVLARFTGFSKACDTYKRRRSGDRSSASCTGLVYLCLMPGPGASLKTREP